MSLFTPTYTDAGPTMRIIGRYPLAIGERGGTTHLRAGVYWRTRHETPTCDILPAGYWLGVVPVTCVPRRLDAVHVSPSHWTLLEVADVFDPTRLTQLPSPDQLREALNAVATTMERALCER